MKLIMKIYLFIVVSISILNAKNVNKIIVFNKDSKIEINRNDQFDDIKKRIGMQFKFTIKDTINNHTNKKDSYIIIDYLDLKIGIYRDKENMIDYIDFVKFENMNECNSNEKFIIIELTDDFDTDTLRVGSSKELILNILGKPTKIEESEENKDYIYEFCDEYCDYLIIKIYKGFVREVIVLFNID